MIANKKLDVSFQIMRTIACFFVIAIHVFTPYFSLLKKISIRSWLYADFVMSISRFSVPLFVMITGALMLKKNITIRKAIQKSIYFSLLLIIWSIAYILIAHMYLNGKTFTTIQIINMLLGNRVWAHLWYMYLIIGLYLVLPIIKKIINEEWLLKYYIFIFIGFSAVSMLPSLLTIFNVQIKIFSMIPIMDWQVGCLVLGYYISNRVKVNNCNFIICILLLIMCNVSTICLTYVESIKEKTAVQTYFDNSYLNIIFAAVSIFIIIKYLSTYTNVDSVLAKFFHFISSISLEIYLVHPMVKLYYEKKYAIYLTNKIQKLGFQYTVKLLLIFIISILIASLIKFIGNKTVKYLLHYKHQSNTITQ